MKYKAKLAKLRKRRSDYETFMATYNASSDGMEKRKKTGGYRRPGAIK